MADWRNSHTFNYSNCRRVNSASFNLGIYPILFILSTLTLNKTLFSWFRWYGFNKLYFMQRLIRYKPWCCKIYVIANFGTVQCTSLFHYFINQPFFYKKPEFFIYFTGTYTIWDYGVSLGCKDRNRIFRSFGHCTVMHFDHF